MDAPSTTSERSGELAALRRRAYGPDADIARDPEALERLAALEAIARSGEADDDAPAVSGAEETAPDVVPVSSAGEPTIAKERPWWRRGPVWALAAAALAVGALIGAAGVSAAAPRPDHTLRVDPGERPGAGWDRTLSSWGMIAGSATPYEDYRGAGVWTVTRDDGGRCILLERDGQPLTAGCVGSGLDPILDLAIMAGATDYFDEPFTTGGTIRLIARDGVVEVWQSTAQNAALETSRSDSRPSAP